MPELDPKKLHQNKLSDPTAFQFGSHHYYLLAIITWIFLGNFIWMLLDIRPPNYDQGLHLFRTFNYWEALSSGSEDWWQDMLNVEPFYPPFYSSVINPSNFDFWFYSGYRSHWKFFLYGSYDTVHIWDREDFIY